MFCDIVLLPPFSLIRDFSNQNACGNVSKISVNHTDDIPYMEMSHFTASGANFSKVTLVPEARRRVVPSLHSQKKKYNNNNNLWHPGYSKVKSFFEIMFTLASGLFVCGWIQDVARLLRVGRKKGSKYLPK